MEQGRMRIAPKALRKSSSVHGSDSKMSTCFGLEFGGW